jgi:hypothetical protein
LQKVLDLGQIGVGVAVIDERVEKLRRLPDALLSLVQAEVLFLLG